MELDFNQKIEEIKKDPKKTFTVTPCEITYSQGYQKRSWGLAERVNKLLDKNELELSGDFYQAWFYAELLLKHKEIATTKVTTNPIKRVDSLAAATLNKPIYVDRNSSLVHAITLMQQYDYSQLPVVSSGERNLCGHISWKTIGLALWHGKKGDNVSDFMSPDITTIPLTTTLLDAVQIIASKEFVIVLNQDKSFSGIITAADIAAEFFSVTQAEAFLLLEQIELQVRVIIGNAGLLVQDLQAECKEDNRTIKNVDDLTFGEYCRITGNPKYWEKLNIKNDRAEFVSLLEEVRLIRNKVMHFERDSIGEEEMHTLRKTARYLTEIINFTIE